MNPVTNRIYVANASFPSVTVIDGASNTILETISIAWTGGTYIGTFANSIAVNPITNRIYVPRLDGATVTVIDGATNTVLTHVPVGTEPYGITINPITNRIYVANMVGNTVSVINGATNTVIATVPVGLTPQEIAVNPTTNHIFVSNFYSNTLSVIDGAANTVIQSLPVGPYPASVEVNPTTNRVYAIHNTPNTTNSTLLVVDDSPTVSGKPVMTAPRTYSSCSSRPTTDTINITNIGNRWLRGRVVVNYITSPTGVRRVPNGLYTVNHRGPAPFQLTVTYPPVNQWPSFINPSTGKPIRTLHVDVQIEVWNANGQPVRNPDGSVLTLGPRQDWGLFCRAVP